MAKQTGRSGKATAQHVAQAAGVSPATVDRVLNGRGGVRPDKERRVLDCARLLRLDRALDQRPVRTLRIAVLIQGRENPFHAALRAALIRAGGRYAHLNMRFFVHELDPTDMVATAALIRACARNHDGLLVTCPNDPATAAAIGAVALHRPVVTLATDVPGSGRHVYVGPDDRKAGRVAADLMGRLLGPAGGEVLMVAGLLSMTGQAERKAGFAEVLRIRYPACRLVDVLESQEIAARAGSLVAEALVALPAIRGIYNASAGARALVEAVARAGRTGTTVLVTHELTPDRRRLLQAGSIDAVIDQDPEHEVQVAVEALAHLFGRLSGAPTSTLTGLHIHMRENA